jgi:UDP-N-acetylmuramate-alanine ligase
MDAFIWLVSGRSAIIYSQFIFGLDPELTFGIKFDDEAIEIFFGLLKNQLSAFHAVIVLRHVFLDHQALVAFAYHVSLAAKTLPPALSNFEAGGYKKAFQLGQKLSP